MALQLDAIGTARKAFVRSRSNQAGTPSDKCFYAAELVKASCGSYAGFVAIPRHTELFLAFNDLTFHDLSHKSGKQFMDNPNMALSTEALHIHISLLTRDVTIMKSA